MQCTPCVQCAEDEVVCRDQVQGCSGRQAGGTPLVVCAVQRWCAVQVCSSVQVCSAGRSEAGEAVWRAKEVCVWCSVVQKEAVQCVCAESLTMQVQSRCRQEDARHHHPGIPSSFLFSSH